MTAIENDLSFIYGPEVGHRIAENLQDRLQKWHEAQKGKKPNGNIVGKESSAGPDPHGSSRAKLSLTERDALLITYGDQLTEAGQAPLQTLNDFFRRHLAGIVSGVHLLPFYPSSSDDGFAVKDFFAVDPALGCWNDIASIGQNFDLMFDGVFNHVSAQGNWFEAFLRGNPVHRNFFITVNGDSDLSQVVRPRALPLLTEFATSSGREKVWTTFSADQVDLNFKQPDVLLAVVGGRTTDRL